MKATQARLSPPVNEAAPKSKPTLLVPELVNGQNPFAPTAGLSWNTRLIEDWTVIVIVSWAVPVCPWPAAATDHKKLHATSRLLHTAILSFMLIFNRLAVQGLKNQTAHHSWLPTG